MHPVCLGADLGAGSGDEVLHSVFDGGAAEVGHCDCWEFGEKAKATVSREEWIVRRAREQRRRHTEERVDEVAATDINQKAGVIEKIGAKERALDLGEVPC